MKILSKKVTIIQGVLLVLVQLNFQLFRNELFKKKKKYFKKLQSQTSKTNRPRQLQFYVLSQIHTCHLKMVFPTSLVRKHINACTSVALNGRFEIGIALCLTGRLHYK